MINLRSGGKKGKSKTNTIDIDLLAEEIMKRLRLHYLFLSIVRIKAETNPKMDVFYAFKK